MEGDGFDVFFLSEFDFMGSLTHLEEGLIRDTPCKKSLGEDWNQFPPLPQGPMGIPPPPPRNAL